MKNAKKPYEDFSSLVSDLSPAKRIVSILIYPTTTNDVNRKAISKQKPALKSLTYFSAKDKPKLFQPIFIITYTQIGLAKFSRFPKPRRTVRKYDESKVCVVDDPTQPKTTLLGRRSIPTVDLAQNESESLKPPSKKSEKCTELSESQSQRLTTRQNM